MVTARCHPVSRTFYDRKRAEGKSHKQAVISLARATTRSMTAINPSRTQGRRTRPARSQFAMCPILPGS